MKSREREAYLPGSGNTEGSRNNGSGLGGSAYVLPFCLFFFLFSCSVFLPVRPLSPGFFLRVLSTLCMSLVPWFPCCDQRMAFLHAFVPHDLFLWEETGAESLLPSVQFLFLRLVAFPVLLPLWKQRSGKRDGGLVG